MSFCLSWAAERLWMLGMTGRDDFRGSDSESSHGPGLTHVLLGVDSVQSQAMLGARNEPLAKGLSQRIEGRREVAGLPRSRRRSRVDHRIIHRRNQVHSLEAMRAPPRAARKQFVFNRATGRDFRIY